MNLIHLRRVRAFLGENYRQPVTLATMSRELGYSPCHLQRQFSRAFGESPLEYVQALRLREARRLLTRSSLTVSEVCLEVGYQSLPTFSALFSKHCGQPPQEFRRVVALPDRWALRQIPHCFLYRPQVDIRKIG